MSFDSYFTFLLKNTVFSQNYPKSLTGVFVKGYEKTVAGDGTYNSEASASRAPGWPDNRLLSVVAHTLLSFITNLTEATCFVSSIEKRVTQVQVTEI